MASQALTPRQCQEAIDAFLRANLGVVHCNDVGPVFGVLARLSAEFQYDAAMRRHWPEALSLALAPDERAGAPQRVQWTQAVTQAALGMSRRASQDALDAPLHARLRAAIKGTRRTGH